MTGKFRRSFASTAVIAATLGLAGCQSSGVLGLGGSEGPSKAAMVEEERQRSMRLAAAAQSAGQYEVALGIYSNLLRDNPAAGDIRSALGKIYFAQGAYDKSLSAFDQALNGVMPTEAERAAAHVGRGRARLATGDAISAERDFAAALTVTEADALAINGLGVAADMQGRHGVAQTRYREALAVDPGNERVRSNLGLSLALAARFDDAIAQLAPLAASSETAQKARYNLALTFGLMGRPSDARELVAAAMAPAAIDGNGLFYAATRGAVRAEAVRASAVRSSNEMGDDLAPHRRLPRRVVNEDLTNDIQAAPVAPSVDAKPVAVKPPLAALPIAKPLAVEPAPVAIEPAPIAVAPKVEKQVETPPEAADVALGIEPETPASPQAQVAPSAAMAAPEVAKTVTPPAIAYDPTDAVDEFGIDDAHSKAQPEIIVPEIAPEPAAKLGSSESAPTVADAPDAVVTQHPEQLAMAPPRRQLTVDMEHLDKNDAFYAAMRVVVDEVNKPTTPWGGPMPAIGAKDQIASK